MNVRKGNNFLFIKTKWNKVFSSGSEIMKKIETLISAVLPYRSSSAVSLHRRITYLQFHYIEVSVVDLDPFWIRIQELPGSDLDLHMQI